MMTLNPKSKAYRFATSWRALKAIYQLSESQVEAFVKAYEIYDCDWERGEAIYDSKKVSYKEVKQNILNWYGVINHLCAVGEVEKMYIPPTLNASENIIHNQIQYEEQFSRLLGMKKGDQVFELGCGKGRVAAHLASLTGANIIGINIDQGQLNSAIEFAKANHLAEHCQFINADFNDLPFAFEDNSFDCIYEIQALSLSRNLEKLFKELHRMLKPGGKLALTEWVKLPNYNPNDQHHIALMKQIKPLVGAIGTPSIAEYEEALSKAGFKVVVSQNPSVDGGQEPLIRQASRFFDRLFPLFQALVYIKVLPKHFLTLFERLGRNTDALCEADQLGLITMSYQFIAEK